MRFAKNRREWLLRYSLCVGLTAVVYACGGGGDAPAGPPPPDNSVARIEVTPATALNLTAGSTATLTANAFTRDNRSLGAGSISWSSSNDAVASVTSGVITARLAGTASITASSGSITSAPVSVTVAPGAAARLVLRTQPDGASSGVALSTQPVVEIRDAAGNLVPTATATITVGVAGGGGTVSGSTTASTVQGVAQFSGLVLSGLVGAKSLSFSATGLSAVTSNSFTLRAGPAAAVAVSSTTLTLRSGLVATTPFLAQLRDREGNDVALAGRTVAIAVQGGSGTTAIAGSTSVTDAQGRAAFPSLVVTGLAGSRTLTVTADAIPLATTVALTLRGGRPTRLRLDRDLPSTATASVPLSPQPIVQLLDSLGNTAPQANVDIVATLASGTGGLSGATVSSDTAGRATFTALTFTGGTSGARAVQFGGTGLVAVTSRAVEVTIDLTRIASVSTSKTSVDTLERMFHLRGPLDTLTPALRVRNAAGQPVAGAVRWTVRDPTRITVNAATGRLTAVRAGRTFVVVQAAADTTIADSLLVFVPQSLTGPLLRTDLKSYRLDDYFRDTVTFSVVLESRDTRRFAGADLSVVLPDESNPLAPLRLLEGSPLVQSSSTRLLFATSGENRLVFLWVPTAENINATVPLLRLTTRRVRSGAEQLSIVLDQLLDAELRDLTSATSILNPILVAR